MIQKAGASLSKFKQQPIAQQVQINTYIDTQSAAPPTFVVIFY